MAAVTLPGPVHAVLAEQDFDDHPPQLAVATDLTFAGQLRSSWLVASRACVAVVSDEEPARLLLSLPLEEVESFRVHGCVGSGLLQARVGNAWIDVLRYSNSLARRFGSV